MLQINEVEKCKFDVKYSAPAKIVQDKRNEVAEELKKESVPGFRPGRASIEAIKHHFKNHINDSLKNKMAQEAYDQLLAEKSLRPFGGPQFTSLSLEKDNFDCSFVLHTVPQFELKQYKGFEIPKGAVPDANEMSEMLLENLRTQFGETVPFGDDDFVQDKNSVIVNLTMKDWESKEVIKKDAELFTIGQAPYQNLNTDLLGMKVGETREFDSVINDDSNLKGRKFHFTVELTMGSKSEKHPLNDELANKLEVENLDKLRELVKGTADTRVKALNQRHLFDQVSARLVEEHQFELPDWLVTAEAKTLAKQYEGEWDAIDDERKNEFLDSGRKSVIFSLVLDKIRQEEPDAQLSEEETMKILRAKVAEAHPGKDEAEVLKNLLEGGQMQMLLTAIKDENTIEFILNNSTIIE